MIASAVGAYVRTLRLARLRSREAIARHHATALRRLIDDAARTTAFYAPFAGASLEDLPIVDKATQLGRFADFNTLGITVEHARAASEGRVCVPNVEIGISTGTSGLRGLYVISAAERFRWLGTMVAKTVPDVAIRRHRVAIVLPGPSPLYQAANESRLLRLHHFDARRGVASLAHAVKAFDPTVLLAAPKSLRGLALAGVHLNPRRVFSAGEVLDQVDARVIERAFGVAVGQVYMATEGLLGTSCRHGSLHLAEDIAAFTLEPVPGDPTLVTSLFTDLTRRTQIMARYRMGDLLRLNGEPCPCGSSRHRVAVVGRLENLITVATPCGRRVPLAPDRLAGALAEADPDLDDYRVGIGEGGSLRILLPRGTAPERVEAVRATVERVCRAEGSGVSVEARIADLTTPFDRKLRRIADAMPETL